jgi:hypothetical protein
VSDDGRVTAGGQPGNARIVVSYEGVAAQADLVVTGDDLISLSLSLSATEVDPGEHFDIVVTIRNRGDEDVFNLSAWVDIAGSEVAAPSSQCTYFPPYVIPGEEHRAGFHCGGHFAPGDEQTLTFTMRSTNVQSTTLVVSAFVDTWEGPADPYLPNNSATRQLAVNDGRIVFVSNRTGVTNLFTIRADGTGLRQLTSNAAAESFPAWAPDRRRIAFIRGFTLWIINADGTGEAQLPVPANNKPTWSPDGRRIAVSGRPPGSDYLKILIYDLAAGSYSALALGQIVTGDWLFPDWSPDGTELLATYEEGISLVHRIRLADGYTTAMHMPYAGTCFVNSAVHARWARVRSAFATDIAVMREGPYRTAPGDYNSDVACPGGYADWYPYVPAGTEMKLGSPAWSPDGRHLIFSARPQGTTGAFDLVMVRADGTGGLQKITSWPADDLHPHW